MISLVIAYFVIRQYDRANDGQNEEEKDKQ